MNYVILGESRSGKSMLAKKICSSVKGYSLISMDFLVLAFKKAFPELNIDYYSRKPTKFSEFLEEYINICSATSGEINYVYEGASMPEEVVLRLNSKENIKVIYLGKPNLEPEEFFKEIRFYEKELKGAGWTKKLDDKTLLSWCTDWINSAKKHKQFCEKNNILFIDTSINQTEILDEIVKKIKN